MIAARKMGIRMSRLSRVEGKTWYTSAKFENLKDMFWPSADSVTLSQDINWGVGRDEDRQEEM